MNDYLTTLAAEFTQHANPEIAQAQKAYLKDQFEFFGLKTPQRRAIQKPFLVKKYLPPKSELESLVKLLWSKPEREFHYFAQELGERYAKEFDQRDLELFEFMITHQSWWDTVDIIATKLVGVYFKKYPEEIAPTVDRWIASQNIWLQRTALLFQLHYKQELDQLLLSTTIQALLGSKEFFINKAIGWALRQYSRTNPDWVREFVRRTPLEPLSRREALRLIDS